MIPESASPSLPWEQLMMSDAPVRKRLGRPVRLVPLPVVEPCGPQQDVGVVGVGQVRVVPCTIWCVFGAIPDHVRTPLSVSAGRDVP